MRSFWLSPPPRAVNLPFGIERRLTETFPIVLRGVATRIDQQAELLDRVPESSSEDDREEVGPTAAPAIARTADDSLVLDATQQPLGTASRARAGPRMPGRFVPSLPLIQSFHGPASDSRNEMYSTALLSPEQQQVLLALREFFAPAERAISQATQVDSWRRFLMSDLAEQAREALET